MSQQPQVEQAAPKVRVRVGETADTERQVAFTTGLWDSFGHPEIVMVGLMPEKAKEGLSVICRAIAGGRRFETPAVVPGVVGPRPVAFVPVRAGTASALLGEDFAGRAMQVFVCDRDSRFPWHDRCDPNVRDAQVGVVETCGEFPVTVTDIKVVPRMH